MSRVLLLSPRYSNLIRELAITEFKLKYQGSVIGYLWSLVKPMAMFAVLYVVFNGFIGGRVGGGAIKHYPIYLLIGVILWSYFAEATAVGMRSVVDKGDLIRKVYFPRIVIPMSSSISAVITMLLNMVVIGIFMLIAKVWPGAQILLILPLLLELYLIALGIALLLGALYVRFRDVSHIWEIATQIMFYLTPIIYPLSLVAGKHHKVAVILLLSPVAQIIQDARFALIGGHTQLASNVLPGYLVWVPYVLPVFILMFGYWYFERAASRFAEDV